MSSFTDPLIVTPLSTMSWKQIWILKHKFEWHIGSKESTEVVEVPEGFETDFASIENWGSIGAYMMLIAALLSKVLPLFIILVLILPGLLYIIFPQWAKHSKASVLHDWLYKSQKIMNKPITRADADLVFLEAMIVDWRCHKLGNFVANLEYLFVRWVGWIIWKRNAKLV